MSRNVPAAAVSAELDSRVDGDHAARQVRVADEAEPRAAHQLHQLLLRVELLDALHKVPVRRVRKASESMYRCIDIDMHIHIHICVCAYICMYTYIYIYVIYL